MRKNRVYMLFTFVLILTSCNDSLDSKDEKEDELDRSELKITSDTSWISLDEDEYFSIDIPPSMEQMELNPEASAEYGWVEKVEDEIREMYVVVLVETKAEIDSFNLDFEFDALSYSKISVESLGDNLDEYKILTEHPEIQFVNEVSCVITETRGTMQSSSNIEIPDSVDVYYILSVFEGENAFYQVLLWCIEDQKRHFKKDMMRIVHSFSEKEISS